MDLLDFDGGGLYFDEPIQEETRACLAQAAERYGEDGAEPLLMRACLLEPEHPLVLVALYRFFYYQHRLGDALIIAERVLQVFARRLGLPRDWRELDGQNPPADMTGLRFYLLALKGAGLLELRLGRTQAATARLEKVTELDSRDRLGARALLDVAQAALT